MDQKNFEKVINKRISHIHNTLQSKSKEYASDKDKLHNFKMAAILEETNSVGALSGMMSKHTVSVYDIINNYKNRKIVPTQKLLDEKIGDMINYLILLTACFYDECPEIVANDNDFKNAEDKTTSCDVDCKLFNAIVQKDNSDKLGNFGTDFRPGKVIPFEKKPIVFFDNLSFWQRLKFLFMGKIK